MARYKTKKIKSIISIAVAIIVVITLAAFAGMLIAKDTREITFSDFKVGGIDERGYYINTETSIYTPSLIKCQGLSIEPKFETSGSFRVFYYGTNKSFIGCTESMKAENGVYTKGDAFANARYCRIVITPSVPLDDEGNEVEDFKISSLDIVGYVNDYVIKVAKKQDKTSGNLLDRNTVVEDKIVVVDITDTSHFAEQSIEGYGYVIIDVLGMEALDFDFDKESSDTYSGLYIFVDENDTVVSSSFISKDGSVEVPKNASRIYINYKIGCEFTVEEKI